MLNTERLKKLKESKWANWLVRFIVPAILLFIIKWHWELNAKMAMIETKLQQDRAQWTAIKQVSDNSTEQEVRLRVAEKIQDWSIMAGILRNVSESQPVLDDAGDRPVAKPRIDVKKIFDKVKKEEHSNEPRAVTKYIQQQMQK